MKGFSYSVCPICGSFTVSSSPISASCCGQPLAGLEMVEAPDGMISIRHDDDGIIASIEHPMTKDEYISFIALESWMASLRGSCIRSGTRMSISQDSEAASSGR